MKFSKLPVVAMVAFGVAGYGSAAFADAAAGKKKHKEKLTLTAQQAADVAAFITGGK
jgi:hypothetical protein